MGAYAAAPTDPAERQSYYHALAADPRIGALEVQWTPEVRGAADLPELGPGVRVVLTVIATTMARRSADPAYGLASTDPAGQAAALADVRQMCALVAELNAAEPVVVAVELHSAPRPGEGAAAAFTTALLEVTGWDWHGATVLVEHCDGVVPGHVAEKGFGAIEDELAALELARAQGSTPVGLLVNWGRSVIEGRHCDTAVAHIARAAEQGLLGAVIFSGVAEQATPAGPAWGDLHLAPAPVAADSLLTGAEMARCLRAAGADWQGLVGLKIGFGLEARPLADRLALVTDSLALLLATRTPVQATSA